MTPKKKTIAQAATESTSEGDTTEVRLRDDGEQAIKYAEPEVKVAEPPKPLTPEQQIEVLQAKVAEHEGNIETIAKYLQRLDPLVAAIEQAQARQQTQAQNPQPQQAGGIDIASLLQMIGPLIGGGGGGDDAFKQMAMDSMKAEIEFSRTFRQLFLSKFGAETATTLAKTALE